MKVVTTLKAYVARIVYALLVEGSWQAEPACFGKRGEGCEAERDPKPYAKK